jgi:hypothetical protein
VGPFAFVTRNAYDAEAQINLAKETILKLRKSIRFFAKQREAGAQFPPFQKRGFCAVRHSQVLMLMNLQKN